jgi:8-oxo-dGTP diphosphatase
MANITTRLIESDLLEDQKLTYVVMGAKYQDKWIFVRHRNRNTWEMPAGHIEPGETADRAAVRELFEEAGVLKSSLEVICDYEVTVGTKVEYGRLYTASVYELESQDEFEIEEVLLSPELPQSLTYPAVQSILFERVLSHLAHSE